MRDLKAAISETLSLFAWNFHGRLKEQLRIALALRIVAQRGNTTATQAVNNHAPLLSPGRTLVPL
jgi:hypothetical protein